LVEAQVQLEKFTNNKLAQMLIGQKCSFDKTGLDFDKIASVSNVSNIASSSKTVFVKPKVAEPQNACEDKGKAIVIACKNVNIKHAVPVMKHSKSRSMPNCYQCGVTGHIKPHCPQIHSHKPWIKKQEPKKGKSGSKPSKPHHVPRQKRQYPQRVAPSCCHYGKTSHTKADYFKLKSRKPKDNQLYEWLVSMIKIVLTRLDKLDNAHNPAPKVRNDDIIHPLRGSGLT
jgi:hypothetical protein